MTPDTPELLPTLKSCPFCGEAPISFPSGDGSGLMIECVTPDCVRPHVSYIPPAAAIAKWNTRSPREGETERLIDIRNVALAAIKRARLAGQSEGLLALWIAEDVCAALHRRGE